MEGEWFHEDDISRVGFEGDGLAVLVAGVGFRPGVIHVEMGAWDDAQCAVGCRGGVEVEACGEHVGEDGRGRLDMVNVIFNGPRPEARGLMFCSHGDGGVAVPGDTPVVIRGFVEYDCADWMVIAEGSDDVGECGMCEDELDEGCVDGDASTSTGRR